MRLSILEIPAGKKISAIKVVRQATGLNLLDAKTLVDKVPACKFSVKQHDPRAVCAELDELGVTYTRIDPEDMEALAAAEHESWSGWTRWMLKKIVEELEARETVTFSGDGEWHVVPGASIARLLMPGGKPGLPGDSDLECIKRWRRQMETPYAELSEREKESDRKVVREKLAVYR